MKGKVIYLLTWSLEQYWEEKASPGSDWFLLACKPGCLGGDEVIPAFPPGSGQEPFIYPSGFPKCQGMQRGGTKTKLGGGKIEACGGLP